MHEEIGQRVEGKELIAVYGSTTSIKADPFSLSLSPSRHQVPVAVYYESLCPDSAKFITEQLYPALKSELREQVEITFVPFGKSQVSSETHNICGPTNNASFIRSSPRRAPR